MNLSLILVALLFRGDFFSFFKLVGLFFGLCFPKKTYFVVVFQFDDYDFD